MLGRCRRRVLVCDRGAPRNRRARALHGYLTRDGIPPTDFNALGRAELTQYGVECHPLGVTGVRQIEVGFEVALADGRLERARFLLIATGVVDELPPIDGIEACHGQSVVHCPYCDGWEWRDRRLAVIGRRGSSAVTLALSLTTWSGHVVVCANGARIDGADRKRLEDRGVSLQAGRIAALEHTKGALETIRFVNGATLPCDALFPATGQHQQDVLAAQLGCTFNRRGTVKTSTLCETNVPGLFVAGDASRDAQFVAVAAAEGLKAAVSINQKLQRL